MYIAEFIFEPGQRDDEFHRLNALIDQAARATEGFLGVENWCATDGTRMNATYYWETLEALRTFSTHPRHMEAKSQYRKWYDGIHIVISRVLKAYGDGAFEHLTPNQRRRQADAGAREA